MLNVAPPELALGEAAARDDAEPAGALGVGTAAQAPWPGLSALAIAMAGVSGVAIIAPLPDAWRYVLWAIVALAWAGMALIVQRVLRQLAGVAGAAQRFVQRLRSDDLGGAIRALGEVPRRGHRALRTAADEASRLLAERERRWHARVHLSGDWYWETDAQGRICWVSDDLASHLKLGLEPRHLLGQTCDTVPYFMPPEGGWPAFMQAMRRRIAFRDVEIEVRRPGRSPVCIALTGRPRPSQDRRFVGYEGVGRDITEQRLAFRRLRDSERRHAVMTELSADWYWETDTEDRFTEIGANLAELLGDEGAARYIGSTRWEAYADGAHPDEWRRHREDLAARRAFSGFEYAVRTTERPPRWVSVSGRPRFDERGRYLGYHGVGRDITLRKQTEQLLRTRNAELERQVAVRTAELEQHNRDLEAFSRQLAHELRTPIGHVIGLSDMLRARAWERLDEEERQLLLLQGQAARAMSQTVTALLELARSGSAPLVRQRVDVTGLAHAVIGELPWLERRSPVEWQIEPGLYASCSVPLLRVVLANLFGNAAKFTRDVATPRVRLSSRGPQGGFVIQDNGAGFDAAQASRLFQPFQRLHDSAQFHGTGLGLSIVRRIVERHGGSVQADSPAGGGARFVFELAPPRARARAGVTTDDVARADS